MIKHIVLWNLHESAGSQSKQQNALENYYPHPEHTKIKPFTASIRSERKVINYEIK